MLRGIPLAAARLGGLRGSVVDYVSAPLLVIMDLQLKNQTRNKQYGCLLPSGTRRACPERTQKEGLWKSLNSGQAIGTAFQSIRKYSSYSMEFS